GKATELILTAMGHSASTDSAKQRAGQLMTIIEAKIGMEEFGKIKQQSHSGNMVENLIRFAG
ncbi:MAG: hypothetical protein DYG86_05670, partial [Chloroflexi bacterium CFX2]|nr:hypothetical protein [Chloroflexi bacterium CFX2]